MYNNPELVIDWDDNDKNYMLNGIYEWTSPSNLAIIKYWGKYGNQLPQNPSLSLTLEAAHTTTSIEFYYKNPERTHIEFFYDEKPMQAFAARIEKYFDSLIEIFPFINQFDFVINSTNSFPHSSGIASSASAMGAVALCLCDIEKQYFGTLQTDEEFYKKASYVARLGSGSAARSVFPGWVEWGQSEVDDSFSNLFATPVTEIHDSFQNLRDAILIVSKKEKSVSSSAGHKLMEDNAFAAPRYKQAHDRLPVLMEALRKGDWSTFGHIAENEALTLHALMMASEESYILMEPNSLIIIEEVRKFRKETGIHAYFSLDAGPNIHLLYPGNFEKEVHGFIDEKLMKYCDDKRIIFDRVGQGPKRLSVNYKKE